MAMGTRKHRQRQEPLWYREELAEAPGHPFYEKLNRAFDSAKFDQFCEQQCQEFYDEKKGRPSLAPGVYFRLMLLGFFEGIDSERGIAWRVADSLSLRQFIGYGMDETTPDHVTISRTRRLISEKKHQHIFDWVWKQLAGTGLIKGKTIGVDSTTLEANAAMKSIVRRDTGESYTEYLKGLAVAEGVDANDAAALRRMDRKRGKKMSNEEWESPSDGEAEITRLKDGRTALAFKVENAVDMETGAIVAVTTHGGATADTETVEGTVIEAGVAVAEVAGEQAPEVQVEGVQEVVADRGYHSNEVLRSMEEMQVRTYIAEPERGSRNWEGKAAERAAVYGNRRRVQGPRGKRLQRQRGERIERNFAHQFDTGGMDRLWVRGMGNVHKKVLLQAVACNLALLMRCWCGAGKPKAAHDQMQATILATLTFLAAISCLSAPLRGPTAKASTRFRLTHSRKSRFVSLENRWFRHGLLGWQCRQGVCYSPKLRATDELLDYQLHGENVAGFDEWYVFTEPADLGEAVSGHPVMELRPGRTLVFVNYYNFAIDTTNEVAGRGLIDLFWQQLERIRPESYIADTSESLTFLTRNRGLFDSVAKGLES